MLLIVPENIQVNKVFNILQKNHAKNTNPFFQKEFGVFEAGFHLAEVSFDWW